MAQTETGAKQIFCGACGAANPPTFRFCGACGTPLVAVAKPEPPAPATFVPVPTSLPVETVSGTAETAEPAQAAPATPPAPILVTTPVVPAAVSVPTVAATSAPPITVPADPIARERERDRLLTLANVQRIRGQITDARETVEQALVMAEGAFPKTIAPIHELRGDLLAVEERWEDAAKAFNTAHELDPARASAERKYAELTLEMTRAKNPDALGESLREDTIVELLGGNRAGKRNAGVAMLLSMFVPGFGQFYNGQVVKGLVLLGVFCFSLLVIALSPDRGYLFKQLASILAMKPGRGAHTDPSALTVFFAVLAFAAWLYSLVDAPFNAGKTIPTRGNSGYEDKSGWEV